MAPWGNLKVHLNDPYPGVWRVQFFTQPKILSFDFDPKKLRAALCTPDDIGAVQRIHFELERVLKHVLAKADPDWKPSKRQMTGPLIDQVASMNVPKVLIDLIRSINETRIRFAHYGQETLTIDEVISLQTGLEILLGKTFPDSWAVHLASKTQKSIHLVYGTMNPKERFCTLCIIVLGVAATLEQPELKASNGGFGAAFWFASIQPPVSSPR